MELQLQKLTTILQTVSTKHPRMFSAFLLLFSGFFLFLTIKSVLPPPHIVTHHRFSIIEKRIRKQIETHPKKDIQLNSLPTIKNADNSILDGWNHPIRYERLTQENHLLQSNGPDGISGGQPDLFHYFKTI